MVDPGKLFAYANRYARKKEATGKGTQYPTLRQCAKRFGCCIEDIEQACDGWDDGGRGYMGIVVGFRTASGIGTMDVRGERQLEAYA